MSVRDELAISPEMMALAQVIASSPPIEETVEEWAQKLATEMAEFND